MCQKQFHQECDLRKHKSAVHEGKRRFVCETCGFPCVSKQSLEKHILSKHEKQILKCPYCDYRETSSKRFYNHYNLMHTKSLILNQQQLHTPMSDQCSQCSRQFENDFILKLHIEFDHQAPKFWCDQCGKQFSTR